MPRPHTDRYVPAVTNGGWPFAAVIIALAVVCIATATYVHKKTYRHPTDVTMTTRGRGASERPGDRP